MTDNLKTEHQEAKGSFSFSGYKKVNEGTHSLMYFKLIQPIGFERAKKILGLNPEAKGLKDSEVDAINAKIYDAMEAVDVISRSYYRDHEYNQIVDTCNRPHSKYDCVYFRDKLAPSEEDAVRNIVMAAVQEGGQAPNIRPFYPIKKTDYVKEIKEVINLREARGKEAAEYFESAKLMNPGLEDEPDAEKIDRMALAGMRHLKKTVDEYGLQDPDTPVSVYTDKEKIESIRKIRSQLKSRNR